jgi:hypothetical protein
MRAVILAITLVGAFLARTAAAQERPAPVAEFAAGPYLFPDDSLVTEGFIGGAARFYLLRRISVGPEISYVQGDNHSHLILNGCLTIDFVGPVHGQPRLFMPFATVGAGLFRSSGRSLGGRDLTYNEGSFTAGGGVRALVGPRLFVGAEARLGWEPHLRVNGFVGVRLGR